MNSQMAYIRGTLSSPRTTMPTSPTHTSPSATHTAPEPNPFPTSTICPPVTPTIPSLDISSSATSVIPPTPSTSLVSTFTEPTSMLSTPSISLPSHLHPISFDLSPPATTPLIIIFDTSSPPTDIISSPSSSSPLSTNITLHSLQANLSCLPFIAILSGVSNKVFLAPQPLSFLSPSPSSAVYTLVILTPVSQEVPLLSLPPPPTSSHIPSTPSPLLFLTLLPSLSSFGKPHLPSLLPIPLSPSPLPLNPSHPLRLHLLHP